MNTQEINKLIEAGVASGNVDTNLISDGYHDFATLYKHRIELWIAVCRLYADDALGYSRIGGPWRTQNHSDGLPAFGGGWMVLGLGKLAGDQLTYHLPMEYWDACEFAETLDKAPTFDGHTSEQVLERLKNLA